MYEKERWQWFTGWTAPYVGKEGLYKLCRELNSQYMAEVVNQNKRYLRFAEDFINSHKFHDAKDARSKNEHEKNLGIIKALLFGNRKIVEKYFPLKNQDDKSISAILDVLDNDSNEPAVIINKEQKKAIDFQCNFDYKVLEKITECFNDCHLFIDNLTTDVVKDFFSCNLQNPIKSNNNRWISLFFSGLAQSNYITPYWKKVIERNRLVLRPMKSGYITANDLYSSLSQTNKKISSSIEFKIFNYLDQIREIIRASEIQ